MTTMRDVKAVKTPPITTTYRPIGHADIVIMMEHTAVAMGLEVVDRDLRLARNGAHFLGCLTMRHPEGEYGIVIGARNSLDKSLSTAVAIGAHIYDNDTMSFGGRVLTSRRTRLSGASVMELLAEATEDAMLQHRAMLDAFERMRGVALSTDDGYGLLGRLLGYGAIGMRDFSNAMHEWSGGPMWDLYKTCTAALATAKPVHAMDRYIELHRIMVSHGA